jgi:hypothetical protein
MDEADATDLEEWRLQVRSGVTVPCLRLSAREPLDGLQFADEATDPQEE